MMQVRRKKDNGQPLEGGVAKKVIDYFILYSDINLTPNYAILKLV
jgi:hypothetical protein